MLYWLWGICCRLGPAWERSSWMFYWLSEACLGLGGSNWLRWQYIRLAGYAQFYHSSFFVFCVATSSLGVVYFMIFSMGACSHFSFRVLVTLITVNIFCVLLFLWLCSFDLNIFLTFDPKKKVYFPRYIPPSVSLKQGLI